jgi:hypothetical protein
MKLLIMQFSSTFHNFIPLMYKYSPQHPVLQTPSVYVPNARDQVSHPYKTSIAERMERIKLREAMKGMKYLRSLERCYRGFESHSRPGYLCAGSGLMKGINFKFTVFWDVMP